MNFMIQSLLDAANYRGSSKTLSLLIDVFQREVDERLSHLPREKRIQANIGLLLNRELGEKMSDFGQSDSLNVIKAEEEGKKEKKGRRHFLSFNISKASALEMCRPETSEENNVVLAGASAVSKLLRSRPSVAGVFDGIFAHESENAFEPYMDDEALCFYANGRRYALTFSDGFREARFLKANRKSRKPVEGQPEEDTQPVTFIEMQQPEQAPE